MTIEDRIAEIEAEIRETPYHKGTEHHIGRLRARLAQLKAEIYGNIQKSGGGGGVGFGVRKSGSASVVLIGPPSVGKSSLLNKLTEANSRVGSYDFTTIWVIPGMMNYKGAQIQIFDVPGIIEGASSGKGRGKEILSVVRSADLVIIMTDIKSIDRISEIKKEIFEYGVRLDENPPKVFIKRDFRGGIKVTSSTPLSYITHDLIRELAADFRIRNGEITIKENITLDRLIDAFIGNRIYLPYLKLINKIDLVDDKKLKTLKDSDTLFVSAENGIGLENLKEKIWEKLHLIRIYLKPKDGKVDLNAPLIVRKGINLQEILEETAIHNKDLITKAKIYGPGAKFSGQEVSFTFKPLDGTIISFY